MTNSIFSINKNTNPIDLFGEDINGLPDKFIINPKTGNLDYEWFDTLMGLSRNFRRHEAKLPASERLLGQNWASLSRLARFLFDMSQESTEANKRKQAKSAYYTCWERFVFDRTLPNWRDDKLGANFWYLKLSDSDKERMQSILDNRIELLSKKIGHIFKKNTKNPTPPIYILHEAAKNNFQYFAGMALFIHDQLDSWDACSEEEKSNLADAAFSCFSLFGKDILEVYLSKVPDLSSHYRTIIGNAKSNRENHGEKSLPDRNNNYEADGFTLSDLYRELFRIAEKAKSDSSNICYAEQIDSLITIHLPRIKQDYALGEDAIRKILLECISVIEGIGRSIPLMDFDDSEFLHAFRTAWLSYFNKRLQQEVPVTFLKDVALERLTDSEEIKQRFEMSRIVTDEATDELAALTQKLQSAKFREKPDLKSQLMEAEELKVKGNKDHHDAERDGYNMLLPPDTFMDSLHEGHNVALTTDEYHPSVKAALQSWDWMPDAALVHRETTAVEVVAEELPAALVIDTPPEVESVPPPIVAEPLVTQEHEVAAVARIEPETVEEVAEDVQIIDAEPAGNDPLPEEEIDISHYLPAPREAVQRLEHCRQTMMVVPAIAAENIALLWLKQGHLPLASKTLEVAGRMALEGDLLPVPLIQAAYQGMHVWRGDTSTVTRILQSMNQLSSEKIEDWTGRRPGGRVVPYLVFAATFQPTVFAGNMTNAPRLLASVASNFDGPIVRMIEELVEFSDHNNRLDVDTLREQPKIDDKGVRSKLAVRIVEWHDRIQNKQTGWAPARKAMKECLELPEFAAVYVSISRDDVSGLNWVRDFAEKYRHPEEQYQLMHDEILKFMNESTTAPQIEGNARNWFLRTLDEVVAIADEWVEGHAQQGQRNSEVGKFARRFVNMNIAALSQVAERMKRTDDIEQKAGLRILHDTLMRVSQIAEGREEPRWEGRRVTGWLAWPSEWLAIDQADDAEQQMRLITSMLVNGFQAETLAKSALARNNFRHAVLLTMSHQDDKGQPSSETIDSIHRLFEEDVHGCNVRCLRMITLLDNANVASLIDDERHYQLRSELEHIQDELKHLQMLDDLCGIHDSLNELQSDIEAKFAVKTQELKNELDRLVRQARVDRGLDSIPESWLEQVNTALAMHETTVAEEMLEHLRGSLETGSVLTSNSESGTELMRHFLQAETPLYAVLNANQNPREVVRHLSAIQVEGLELDTLASAFKRGLEDLVGMRNRVKNLDKPVYEVIVHVLHALGLDAVTSIYSGGMEHKTGFTTHNKFARLMIQVKRKESGRGIVFFRQRSDEQAVNILIASGEWTVAELRALLTDQFQAHHDRTILISGRPLSNDERNDLATFCKREKHTLYHVDPVLMAMLAGLNVPDSERLKTFLQLTLPWTSLNPYTGNQMQPAPPEMRYGRQDDIKRLTTMRNGAAMIFGGRQLGKTTLLNETQRIFHNPSQRQHAYIHQMDGNLDRANLSGDELERHRKLVWRTIYNDAVESGLIKDKVGLDTEGWLEALKEYFRRENCESLMVCLDEIDPILGLDAANGFRIFRDLSGLVNNSNGHFKVVIAGLENVRRFADAPNYPLHQLGSAIQVSIMSPMEALQLIREPLGHLGYEFESPLLMNRILVETNRHPGLIHIFCHELIKTLSARHQGRIGNVKITLDDIDQIRKDPTVHELICDRFDITLNLDLRYKLIAYSLISQSKTTFSPSRAKAIVEEWAPEIFRPMTEAQFEAFLDELCGLGVLHYMRRTEGGKEYALRNTNIMNLVGGPQKIEDKLLGAIDAIKDNDPLSGHAFPDKALRPSPLTLRDEKLLISEEKKEMGKPNSSLVVAKSSNYSVGIITGSEALGLNPLWMVESLLAIGEEEPSIHQGGGSGARYIAAHKKDTDFQKSDDFKKLLNESVLGVQSLKNPIMLFVELTGEKPISNSLDLLDVAQEARLNINSKRNRVRVIFLMTPKALWQWVSYPDLTAGRESMQPFVALDVWKKTALAHLLNKLELENTSMSIDLLELYSQGWYFSLDRLMDAKKKKPDVLRVDGFGQAYSPILQAKPKSMEEFLSKAGVMAVDWAQPVLAALCEEERFDADDLALQLMEQGFAVNPEEALSWLSRLRLIKSINVKSKQSIYKVSESISAALLAKSAQEARA